MDAQEMHDLQMAEQEGRQDLAVSGPELTVIRNHFQGILREEASLMVLQHRAARQKKS